MLRMLIWMSLAGGALTVVMLVAHKVRKSDAKLEIPYGVAIALATAPLIAERYIYHFR
jgi:prepilin peptidase CpaA